MDCQDGPYGSFKIQVSVAYISFKKTLGEIQKLWYVYNHLWELGWRCRPGSEARSKYERLHGDWILVWMQGKHWSDFGDEDGIWSCLLFFHVYFLITFLIAVLRWEWEETISGHRFMFILVNNEEGMEPYLEGRLNWT